LSIANPSTKICHIDEPTPDIPINEIGETSQTPATIVLTGTFPQDPDPVPVTVTPSIVAYPPSVSVGQQGESSDTPESIASDLTLFHPLDANQRQNLTPSHAGSDITPISSKATQIHNSIPSAGVTLQMSEGSTGIPHITVSDPQSLPPPSTVNPTEPPPSASAELALVQPDQLSQPLGSLSSTVTTANYNITPQVPSVLGTTSIGDLSSHERETHDPNSATPTEAFLHVQQSGPSTPPEA
jgi:hypothetical protein